VRLRSSATSWFGSGGTDAPAAVVRAFKGRTARVLRAEFPYLLNRATVLWSPSYFVNLGRVCIGVDDAPLHRAPMGRVGLRTRLHVSAASHRASARRAGRRVWSRTRELYNAALQERRDAWSHSKTRINYGDQSAQLTCIRAERPDQASGRSRRSRPPCGGSTVVSMGFFRRVRAGQKAATHGSRDTHGSRASSGLRT